MSGPTLPIVEAMRRIALVEDALRAGYPPPGIRAPNGTEGAISIAAISDGKARSNARRWLRAAERALGRGPDWTLFDRPYATPKPFEVVKPPGTERSLDEVLEARRREWARRDSAEDARGLIDVRIAIEGPIALAHFGDPHVDDPGCDIVQLEADMRTVNETEAMFACNVGDLQNNWIGRLAHLYREQTVTAREAWMLVEWLVTGLDWLFIVAGNHDVWTGAGDPVRWMMRNASGLYEPYAVRVRLVFPNGREVRVNCRHEFPGASRWNPGHGPMKAVLTGARDHIVYAGHRHVSAYSVLKDPQSGLISHCIQAGGYKKRDALAKEQGLADQNIFATGVTVIDPERSDDDPRMITFFMDVAEAADYLRWKRGNAK